MMRKALFVGVFVLGVACAFAGECGWCGVLSLESAGGSSPTARVLSWSRGESETNRIDVLFAFDESARRWLAECGDSVDNFSSDVLEQMNASLTLTGLERYFQFRLAGTFDVLADVSSYSILHAHDYASGKSKKQELEAAFVPLRRYRDEVAADIVILFEAPLDESWNGATLALWDEWFTKEKIAQYAEYAYCAVNIRVAFTRWTALHEIGHVFGAGHSEDNKETTPGPQLRRYSSGYQFTAGGKKYSTVMSYAVLDTKGNVIRERLPFFSSPDWTFGGVPVGTAGRNDNTRTLRETYPIIANFRVSSAISGWSGEPIGGTAVALSVQDASGIEIGNGTVVTAQQFVNTGYTVTAEVLDESKVVVKMKGLPSGLKFSSKAGVVTGYPKRAGEFTVKTRATVGGTAAEMTFTLNVRALPPSVPGTYVGIVSNAADGVVLATATVSSFGKVSVKLQHLGLNKTFSCTAFDSVEGGYVFTASPRTRIKGTTHILHLRLDNRKISIDGYHGLLMQNPWKRKDVAAPVFGKRVNADAAGFTFSFSGKGKVKVNGRVGDKKVSGVFQMVSGGDGQYLLPVAFAPKRTFSGWAGMFVVELTLDAKGKVSAVIVRPYQSLEKE